MTNDVIGHLDRAIDALESIGATRYDTEVSVAHYAVTTARATLTDDAIAVDVDTLRPVLAYLEEKVTNRKHLRGTDLAAATKGLRDRVNGRGHG